MVIEYNGVIRDFALPLFANGSPTMVFQTAKVFSQKKAIGNLSLYGQTVTPDELVIKDNFTLIAYFFYPHVLKSLFGLNAAEVTDVCIDLNDLKQAKQSALQEQLLNALSLEKRLQLIDNFVLKLAALFDTDDRKVVYATQQLRNNTAPGALLEVQQTLNISERTFQRLFEFNVGISPKMYKRICQFHSAFQQLNQKAFLKLSDIAYDNGFADQSHFIRVLNEFTNLTPKEYLTKRSGY